MLLPPLQASKADVSNKLDQTRSKVLIAERTHFYLAAALAFILILHLSHDIVKAIVPQSRLFQSDSSINLNAFNRSQIPCMCPSSNSTQTNALLLSSRKRMREVLGNISHEITYVQSIDTIFTTMAKAGSSTIWFLIYLGLSGKKFTKTCGIPQNKTSPCWQPYASSLKDLSEDEQWNLLTNNRTLRVDIQRKPFPRLVSGFKNKLSCDAHRYNSTIRAMQMHRLRRDANLPPGVGCMNVSEFADALDRIRGNVGKPGFLPDTRYVDPHFKPQNFFSSDIYYHLVLDASDLSNYTKLELFLNRLPYDHLVRTTNLHVLDTGSAPVFMDDRTAGKLHNFAQLSKWIDST